MNDAYRETEEKITKALRAQAKHLDLSSLQLTALPESLAKLTWLLSLNIEDNRLTSLPEWLGNLSQLQELDTSYNELNSLPECLGRLTQLKALEIASNKLETLPECLGRLTQLQSLNLSQNQFTSLPEWLAQLIQLQSLNLSRNKFTSLPEWLDQLPRLQALDLSYNHLTQLPSTLRRTVRLEELLANNCRLDSVPHWVGSLSHLERLCLEDNRIKDLPQGLGWLEHLKLLRLDGNPLSSELALAYNEGFEAFKHYLRARARVGELVELNEAKLILIGEGEVGKSCLLGALRGDEWIEGLSTTHGIEIKPVKVIDPVAGTEITLNGWDFGGQPVYRPTHQLFFSAPAVYLVVWKPREGAHQGFVKGWIKLVKHRAPEAKIFVVATHGGASERQPDIDRQEIWDLFGEETVHAFFHVDSKPDPDRGGERRNIEELKKQIAKVAARLPEMGRSVSKRWQEARLTLQDTGKAYLELARVFELCRAHEMDDDEARLFVTLSHGLGHLIHYEHDPLLGDIVVLKPDWLATAISFVLDDEETRRNHGIISSSRLSKLWNDPGRETKFRYEPDLHPHFLRLMERYDLSYKVALPNEATDAISFWQQIKSIFIKAPKASEAFASLPYTSLIAQLVPDNRPEQDLKRVWPDAPAEGDVQQEQTCRIVDAQKGQSATAEGLFYQLIVRLHKYSLGRVNYHESIHWQRGLVLDGDYNGRALLEHVGNDIRITVRAPYPERFLSVLTYEVEWLVKSLWKGMRCEVVVPCLNCLNEKSCTGLFDVHKLIENKKRKRLEQPCPICNEWQNIDRLLRNAPAARPLPTEELLNGFVEFKRGLSVVRAQIGQQHGETMGRLNQLNSGMKRLFSKVDDAFTGLIQALTDEGKDGPRLFSLVPVNRSRFNPKNWTSEKFRLTLWCEHSRLPLPLLNPAGSKRGIVELELKREWVKKAAPFLKVLGGTLNLVLPVAASATKLILDADAYQRIDDELDFGQKCIEATLEGGEKISSWLGQNEGLDLEQGEAKRAQGATLRELHALLREKDPGFGGLVRVLNKRHEFLWVHEQYAKEY